MSDIRVGVIGVGIMGAGHARYITDSVDGAVVTAFFDLDAARMDALANELSAKFEIMPAVVAPGEATLRVTARICTTSPYFPD